jgi:ABC-type sulfate transport system permease component
MFRLKAIESRFGFRYGGFLADWGLGVRFSFLFAGIFRRVRFLPAGLRGKILENRIVIGSASSPGATSAFSPGRRLRSLRLQNLFFGGWSLMVFAFLYLPIALLVVFSFNSSKLNIRWEGFSTKWYEALLTNKVLITAFENSLLVALFTTLLSTLLGTIGAWMLHRYKFPYQRTLALLIFIPMVMPEVLMGVSLLVLFVQFLNLPLGFTTLVISHTTFCFPFVLVGVQARLQGLDPFLEEAAMDLGATPLWLAAQNGSAAMTRRLLQAGADPNLRLLAGETPLMVAARLARATVPRVLATLNSLATGGRAARAGWPSMAR